MRTWNEICDCLSHDTMYKEVHTGESPGSKTYLEFANEVIHYLSEFIKEINAEVIESHFDDAVFDIIFKRDNKLYVSRNYRGSPRLYVYAIDKLEDYRRDMYRQRKITMLKDTNPYARIGLPKHSTLKIGDLVKLRKSTPYYKYKYDYNKVLRIENIIRRGTSVLYRVKSVGPKCEVYMRFAEGNLRKLDNGL